MNTRILKTLSSIAIFASVAFSAQAVSYYADVDLIGEKISKGESVKGNFNLKDNGGDSFFDILSPAFGDTFGDGFDPSTQMITGAWAFFTLADDWDFSSEKVKIKIGGDLFDKKSVSLLTFSHGLIGIDALIDLNEDGELSYKIKSTKGDFVVLNAGLKASYAAKAVPDGGSSLILLGFGLAGIVALRRRNK